MLASSVSRVFILLIKLLYPYFTSPASPALLITEQRLADEVKLACGGLMVYGWLAPIFLFEAIVDILSFDIQVYKILFSF
jgi:hypothetical protein